MMLLALACSRSKSASNVSAAPSAPAVAAKSSNNSQAFSLKTVGEPYALQFVNGGLSFCDNRGIRFLELNTGKDDSKQGSCPRREEPDPACNTQHDVEVRSPTSQPGDIIDVGAQSFPLKGRVHDCSSDGKILAVVTASGVTVIDLAKEKSTEVSQEGGERVAVGDMWIAWTSGENIHAVKLKS
jgi:hypothetical protein